MTTDYEDALRFRMHLKQREPFTVLPFRGMPRQTQFLAWSSAFMALRHVFTPEGILSRFIYHKGIQEGTFAPLPLPVIMATIKAIGCFG